MLILFLATALSCSGRVFPPAAPQAEAEAGRAARVRAAVLLLVARPKARVRVTVGDLSEWEGRAAEPGADSFILVVRVAKGLFLERRVAYDEVLELRGDQVSLSFFPDPAQRPYGTWETVRRLEFGDMLELTLAGGRRVKGRVNNTTETELSLLGRDGVATEYGRREIVRIFRIGDGSGGAVAGAGSGMAKGVKVWGGLRATREGAVGAGVVGGVGAGVGALTGAASKGRKRLLLYAQ